MNKKSSIILYVIVLLAVLAMFGGTAYAYYLKTAKTDKTEVTVKKINLLIEYENGEKVNLNNLKYDTPYEYTFSIKNDSKDQIAQYKLQLDVITPLALIVDENFKYNLTCSNDSNDNTNKFVNIEDGIVPVANKELGIGVIAPNNSHNCKVEFIINKKDQDKDYLNNKIFVAKFKALSYSE